LPALVTTFTLNTILTHSTLLELYLEYRDFFSFVVVVRYFWRWVVGFLPMGKSGGEAFFWLGLRQHPLCTEHEKRWYTFMCKVVWIYWLAWTYSRNYFSSVYLNVSLCTDKDFSPMQHVRDHAAVNLFKCKPVQFNYQFIIKFAATASTFVTAVSTCWWHSMPGNWQPKSIYKKNL